MSDRAAAAAAAAAAPVLRRSTRSTRAARFIDAPYWESLGFDRLTAMNMANFTHFIEKGNKGVPLPYQNGGNNFVPFHEQLLPHWRAFTKIIEEDMQEDECGDSNDHMEICHLQMPKQVLDVVKPAVMRVNCLRRLDLDNNRLDRDGFAAVGEILKHWQTLAELNLARNEIPDVESAKILSEATRDHPGLIELRLPECGIGKNIEVLEAILYGAQGSLTLLDLRANGIDARCAPAVSTFISGNHAIQILDLEGNKLTDNSVPSLVTAIKKNTNLSVLDMVENEMTREGRELMMKAVFDTSSLNNVATSNHTCQLKVSGERDLQMPIHIMGISLFSMIGMGGEDKVLHEDVMKKINGMPVEERHAIIRYKQLRALCQTWTCPSDQVEPVVLGHLNDLPVQCMPRVLEMIQTYMHLTRSVITGHSYLRREENFELSEEALSRVFHVLKGWQMPSLFECGISSAKPKQRGRAAVTVPGRGKRKRSVGRK